MWEKYLSYIMQLYLFGKSEEKYFLKDIPEGILNAAKMKLAVYKNLNQEKGGFTYEEKTDCVAVVTGT